MHWSDAGWGWGGWLAMSFSMLLFWGLVVAGVVALLRTYHRGTGDRSGGTSEAQRLLDERFARGEIDEQDYRARRDLLARR